MCTNLFLAWLMICLLTAQAKASETKEKHLSQFKTNTSLHAGSVALHLRQKRHDTEPYFPEYPETFDYYDYQGQNTNYLSPVSIAGGAGLALKAAKTKAKLKGLKLLALPAGIALLGGIAALASGVIPPAVIGGINLPFQGKRRKRDTTDLEYQIPFLYEGKIPGKRKFN